LGLLRAFYWEKIMTDTVTFENGIVAQGFAAIYHAITLDGELSDGAYRLYALLLKYAWGNSTTHVSRSRLASDLGTTEKTITRRMSELARLGYIRREQVDSNSWNTIIADVSRISRLDKSEQARAVPGQDSGSQAGQNRAAEEESEQEHVQEQERVLRTPRSRSEKQRERDTLCRALSQLCFNTDNWYGGLLSKAAQANIPRFAKRLHEAGIKAGDVQAFSRWWYSQDWRGRNGDPPRLAQVTDNWGAFEKFKQRISAPDARDRSAYAEFEAAPA
jgi:hypothetical protein